MNNRRIACVSVRKPFASGSRVFRCALSALLMAGTLGGQVSIAAQPGSEPGMPYAATLAPLQPDSGSATVAPGQSITLSAIKKIDDHGVAGQKVDWTVTGPGPASLTPDSSKTAAQSTASDAGVATTVFRALTPGSYTVNASTQKNPGCSGRSCATYVSIRFALDVAAAATTEPSSGSSGVSRNEVIGAAIGIGAAIAIAENNNNNNNKGITILRTLALTAGDAQSAAANTPLPQPLVVHAENNGVSVASIGVHWSASGGAVLSSPVSFTDANGVAAVRVLSVGPGPGPVTITATRSDDSSATVSFTANVLLPSLRIVSGDGQTGFANSRVTNPLVVEADLGANPQAGVPITWAVTGGDASIVSNTGATNGSGQSSAIVKFGPVPGPVLITATRADGSGVSQTFHLTSTQTFAFVIVSGDQQSGFTNTRVTNPLVVEADLNGAPEAAVPVTWAVTGGDASIILSTSPTNGVGQARAFVKFGPNPGPVDITATRTDQNLSQTFHLTSIQTNTLTIVAGDQQTGPPNAALPIRLVVNAQTNNAPIRGVPINWSASGGATLSVPTSVTNGAGNATVKVTNVGPGPGPIMVTATRADDPAATVMFTENIIPPTLTIVSGNGQSGLIGSPAAAALVVKLVDGAGMPVSGQPIAWVVTGGSATVASPSTNTDPTGQATVNFTYGNNPGAIVISASAYGGLQVVNFNETATNATALLKITGDGQSGAPGAPLPVALKVRIQAPPGSLAGVPITFTVLSGSATVTVSSTTTDPLGEAKTNVKLGLTPGTVKVLAQVSGGGPSATFTETVTGVLVPGALTIVSGDKQTIAPNTASVPLVVLLKGNGAPLAGQTITWSATSGNLSTGSSVTDASGHASTILTPTASGPIAVTANFAAFAQFTAAQVTFSENTTLSSVATQSSNDVSVGVALDTACSSLQSIANRTQQQQDLLNQCLSLNASSSVSPTAAAAAIHQLTPDVTETQSQTAATATTAQFNNLSGRMNALRGGAQGVSLAGLAFNNSSGSLPLSDVGSALLGVNDKPKEDTGNSFSRWGFFGSGQIDRQNASVQGSNPAYNLDVNGLTFGVDYRKSDSLVLGGAVGYTHQKTTLAGGDGDLSMSGWSLSGYATWYRKNNWYLDSSITWANNNYDSRRHISFSLPLPDGTSASVDQLAQASSGGNNLAGSLTFGRDFNNKAWAYGLYGKAQYSRQSFDAFQEQLNASMPGSGLGLRVDSRSVTQVDSVLGGKIDYTHSTGWGVMIPHAEAEWQHQFRGNPDAFRAFFVNDPTNTPILITGAPIDTDFFRLGLGMSFVFPHGRSAFVLYDRTIGERGISEYNLSLGFRTEF